MEGLELPQMSVSPGEEQKGRGPLCTDSCSWFLHDAPVWRTFHIIQSRRRPWGPAAIACAMIRGLVPRLNYEVPLFCQLCLLGLLQSCYWSSPHFYSLHSMHLYKSSHVARVSYRMMSNSGLCSPVRPWLCWWDCKGYVQAVS